METFWILISYFYSLWSSRSSIALQIWQPQAVRSRHHEVLQQETVNVGARQKSLQMEINVCRYRIQQFEKSLVYIHYFFILFGLSFVLGLKSIKSFITLRCTDSKRGEAQLRKGRESWKPWHLIPPASSKLMREQTAKRHKRGNVIFPLQVHKLLSLYRFGIQIFFRTLYVHQLWHLRKKRMTSGFARGTASGALRTTTLWRPTPQWYIVWPILFVSSG